MTCSPACVLAFRAATLLSLAMAGSAAAEQLPGFAPSPHFAEQLHDDRSQPDVNILINAPGDFDPRKPTLLVLYALPNGNSIAQTVGRRPGPDIDWRHGIQHIGAQVRHLRAADPARNLVVAYLEADGKSWPTWRGKRPDSGARIERMIQQLRQRFGAGDTRVALTCHSGGGALLLDYIDHVEAIPAWIDRIVFLDANYSYETRRHAAKLLRWLQAPDHVLGVYAYDDRDVTYKGKPIVSPTGGTWRATERMRTGLAELGFTETDTKRWQRSVAGNGRAELIRLHNPDEKILHTVMVERNGLIHALTFTPDQPDGSAAFYSEAVYQRWIQP